MRRVVVVGDVLLDRDVIGTVDRVCPDAPVPVVDEVADRPRPGGAGLAACLLAGDGAEVTLVTALGRDAAGATVGRLLRDAGVTVVDLGLGGDTPEKIRIRVGGQSLVRLDRGGPPSAVGDPAGEWPTGDAVLVADYGRGVTSHAGVRSWLASVRSRTPVVWDPHPRGADPVAGCRLATPNAAEAERLVVDAPGEGLAQVTARAEALAQRWRASAVAVTLGSRGALLAGTGGAPLVVGAPVVGHGDTCGAGDRFAGSAALALAGGAVVPEAVEAAVNAASAFVAAGAATSWLPPADAEVVAGPVADEPAEVLAARVRGAGGTVVATGGCFDLVHAGHVATLDAARRLGDCLVVCLNSDDSVRRLKGADRPLQPAVDRAAVLLALGSVDAVLVFDEDTPDEALRRLRPHVFVKGGDYAVADLPEARTVSAWGGQAVVVPYVSGRSTTRLLEEAARRGQR